MPSKEELLHDINMVVSLSSKQDMSMAATAQKYVAYFEQKKTLKSAVGQQYLARLKQISEGSAPKTCFICKKNNAYDGILCEDCMSKYSRGTKKFYDQQEKEDFSSLDELFESSPGREGGLQTSTITERKEVLVNKEQRANNSGGGDSQEEKKQGSNSGLGIAAFILSLTGIACIVGLILGIIDLRKKDGRKHGLSSVAVIISSLFILGFCVAMSEEKGKSDVTSLQPATYEEGQMPYDNEQTAEARKVHTTTSSFMDAFIRNMDRHADFQSLLSSYNSSVSDIHVTKNMSTEDAESYYLEIYGANLAQVLFGVSNGYPVVIKLNTAGDADDDFMFMVFMYLCQVTLITADDSVTLKDTETIIENAFSSDGTRMGNYHVEGLMQKVDNRNVYLLELRLE